MTDKQKKLFDAIALTITSMVKTHTKNCQMLGFNIKIRGEEVEINIDDISDILDKKE